MPLPDPATTAVTTRPVASAPTSWWLGTYPPDGPEGQPGSGEGIWRLDLDPATGALTGTLAATTPAPSFLALSPDRRTLYAAGETASGAVTCFAVGPDGGLTERAQVASGGASPCHLTVDATGRTLYVANYAGGTLGVLPLEADGGFSSEVLAAAGPVQVLAAPQARATGPTGPVPDRQESPHAHSSLLSPDGWHLLVADLGTDELRTYRVGPDGLLTEAGAITLPPGTGPRHLAWGPGLHLYVVGELAGTVLVLSWDPADGATRLLQELPAWAGTPSPAGAPAGGRPLPAHLVRSGDLLLVSVRGPDVLARFAVHDDGARLELVGDVPVGGVWPRHFALASDPALPAGAASSAGWALAAVQGSGRVTALRWTGRTLEPPAGPGFAVPYPACVVSA